MSELKPCPFCGGAAQLNNTVDENDFYVSCDVCEIQQVGEHTMEEAVRLWNTRVQ